MDDRKVSKYMAYLLRHDPQDLEISDEGFVDMDCLMEKLGNRWRDINIGDVERIVENDVKGRYEVKGGRIRARYGHSIDVDPSFSKANRDILYHGTTPRASKKIMKEGLNSGGRKKVHLSANEHDAEEVGRRRTDNPVILKIEAKKARKNGIRIERASEKVYVADYIPADFIEKL